MDKLMSDGEDAEIIDIQSPRKRDKKLPSNAASWGEDDLDVFGEYSIDKYYTHTKGPDGSSQVSMAIDARLRRSYDILIQSGMFPQYQVVQDAMRNHMFHGIKYDITCLELKKDAPRELTQLVEDLEFAFDMANEAAREARLTSALSDLVGNLERAVGNGDEQAVARIVARAKGRIRELEAPWSGKYRAAIAEAEEWLTTRRQG